MHSVWQRLNRIVPQGRFMRAVTLVALGTVLGQGAIVAAAPVLTRLYTTENFGTLAVFVSLYTILVSVNSLAYELAIPLPEDDHDSAQLLVLVLGLVLLTTGLFAIGVTLLAEHLAAITAAPELNGLLWLLPLGLLMGGFYQGLNYWTIRKKSYRALAVSRISLGVGMVAVQMIGGALAVGAGGLLAGHVAAFVAAAAVLAVAAWRSHGDLLRGVDFAGLWRAAARYRRFPQFTSWSNLLNTAGLNLPSLLVAALYGAETAGLLMLGQRVIGAPMALLGTSVAQVYLGRAAELKRDDPPALERMFYRTAARLLLVGLLPIMILLILGPPLFALVFGAEWETAGRYVQLLAPAMLMQFMVSPISQTIFVLERQDLQFLWDVGRVLLLLLIFAIARWQNWQPVTTIAVYAAGYALAYGVLFWMYHRVLKTLRREDSEWQS